MKFKTYSIQFEVIDGAFERNYIRFLTLLNLCEKNSLIVAPELFLTGFYYKDLKSAASFSKRVFDELLKFSKGLKLTLIYTTITQVNGKFFNCIQVIEDGELLLSRPKIKLFRPNRETDYFNAGDWKDLKVARTKFGTLAPIICFELRFSEIFQKLKRDGAQLFAISAQWGRARKAHWEVLCSSRAIEFQRFLISSNATGKMAGSSSIVDPWGRTISSISDGEGVIFGEIELSRIEQVERKLPME